MQDERVAPLGLDSFWEQADSEASSENPLERELGHRLDALMRYQQMIEDALANGRDEVAEMLQAQHDRQARLVQDLRAALRRRP